MPADESNAAQRVLRALGGADGESRPRRPEDATDPDVPVAATVVLVRDAADGPEVLLIERPDRGSFAGAWVFPGGKIEAGDRDPEDREEQDAARRAAVRETFEETGLVLDPAVLVTLSVWDPPPGLALRIRTWFFVAAAPRGALVLNPAEAVGAEWVRPSVLLDRHAAGAVTLYPPTWVTLEGLRGDGSSTALAERVRASGPQSFDTVARRTPEGPRLLWQGDAEYDGATAEAASARHRLDIGALPWRYTRAE